MTSTVQRTLEQLRLEYAIRVVGQAKAKAKAETKAEAKTESKGNAKSEQTLDFEKYAVRCASLPAQIMQSGLHQALLFCTAKDEPDYKELYEQISDWLIGGAGVLKQVGKDKDVLVLLAQHSMETYMQATRETLALLVHIKRIAKASKGGK